MQIRAADAELRWRANYRVSGLVQGRLRRSPNYAEWDRCTADLSWLAVDAFGIVWALRAPRERRVADLQVGIGVAYVACTAQALPALPP